MTQIGNWNVVGIAANAMLYFVQRLFVYFRGYGLIL